MVAALTLSAPAGYYAITRVVDGKALILYTSNFLFFGSSISYVKMRIEFLRMRGRWDGKAGKARLMTIIYHLLLVAFIVVMSLSSSISSLMFLGFVPMLVQVAFGMFSSRYRLVSRCAGKEPKINFTRLGVMLILQSVIFLVSVGVFWR